ncbi:MAG: conserved predicted metal-dependent hydrolase [Caulobacteraceae bacterium]|nr:conserved predicted metal-dependent hydrolase [Caulobacteraceae bacterium]
MKLFRPRYVDGQTLDIGGVMVRLRVSGRARRVSLRVDRVRGEAVAVAPTAPRLAEAAEFAASRRQWLAEHLAARPAPAPGLAADGEITVFGVPWRLWPDGRRPRLEAGEAGRRLLGCGEGAVDPQLVARAIRREAVGVFDDRAGVHCAALGVAKPPLALMDARTRWGSCTPARAGRTASIRLSWRLALAPPSVADYVVAHECAHLLEANHGPRFWAHVRTLVGDEKRHRGWLRNEGASLHAVLPRVR